MTVRRAIVPSWVFPAPGPEAGTSGMFRPHVIAVVIEQGVLGGHPPVGVRSALQPPEPSGGIRPGPRPCRRGPGQDFRGSLPQTSARTWGKLGLVGFLLSRGGRDHDPARGGQGGQKRARGRRGDPEHLLPARNAPKRAQRTHRRAGPDPADGSRHGRRADWHDPGRAPRAVLRKPILARISATARRIDSRLAVSSPVSAVPLRP